LRGNQKKKNKVLLQWTVLCKEGYDKNSSFFSFFGLILNDEIKKKTLIEKKINKKLKNNVLFQWIVLYEERYNKTLFSFSFWLVNIKWWNFFKNTLFLWIVFCDERYTKNPFSFSFLLVNVYPNWWLFVNLHQQNHVRKRSTNEKKSRSGAWNWIF